MTEHMSPDPSRDVVPLEPGEKGTLEQREVAGLSQSQIVRKRFFRHRGAVISLTALILILLLSATSIGWGPIPGWWRHNYFDVIAPPEGAGASL